MIPVNVRSTKDKRVVCSYDVPLVSVRRSLLLGPIHAEPKRKRKQKFSFMFVVYPLRKVGKTDTIYVRNFVLFANLWQ